MFIGYHASHEEFSPRDLIDYAVLAEKSGFSGVMSSDHISPWSMRQRHSGFVWPWLGAALQATESVPFGCLSIPGGMRYHPVTAAHNFATLQAMFPNRMPWIAAGSGEALNEHMTGEAWPQKSERNERMKVAVDIMRRMWRGESVTEDSHGIKARNARLWTLPSVPPKIYAAALSPETAGWAGMWADGLITVKASVETVKGIIAAFRENGGAGKPLVLQMQLGWARDEAEARRQAHDQWRHVVTKVKKDELKSPEEFDKASAAVTLEDMDDAMLISADIEKHALEIKKYMALGFDEIYLHNVALDQKDFIASFGENLLPCFGKKT